MPELFAFFGCHRCDPATPQLPCALGRVVLQGTGKVSRVLKDDYLLLRQPGSDVRTETFNDGFTRSFVTRSDGSVGVTIRVADAGLR